MVGQSWSRGSRQGVDGVRSLVLTALADYCFQSLRSVSTKRLGAERQLQVLDGVENVDEFIETFEMYALATIRAEILGESKRWFLLIYES